MEKKTWSEIVAQHKALSEPEKEAVANFFNLHNASIWIYNGLSEAAKQYCEACIQASIAKADFESEDSSEAKNYVDNVGYLNV